MSKKEIIQAYILWKYQCTPTLIFHVCTRQTDIHTCTCKHCNSGNTLCDKQERVQQGKQTSGEDKMHSATS